MDLQPNKTDGIIKPITNTRISASEWNQLVGSCMAFITAAGFTPDAGDNNQFLNAFIQIAQNMGAIGANVDLSNLSATGEARFATPDFNNVNATGTSKSAGWAMPSATYTDLILGASGASYTAPANGWFVISGSNSSAGTTFLSNLNSGIVSSNGSAYAAYGVNIYVPALKNDEVSVTWNLGTLTATSFKFIYAEGSKSEAN